MNKLTIASWHTVKKTLHRMQRNGRRFIFVITIYLIQQKKYCIIIFQELLVYRLTVLFIIIRGGVISMMVMREV